MGQQTSKIWRHVYFRKAALADQVRQAPSENYVYAIVRPNALSVPEMLDSYTCGRMSYRYSPPTCFLVLHVTTWSVQRVQCAEFFA